MSKKKKQIKYNYGFPVSEDGDKDNASKLYISDFIAETKREMSQDKINMIVAPTGSGKTFYTFDKLIPKHYKEKLEQGELPKILYVCGTNGLEKSVNSYEIEATEEFPYDIEIISLADEAGRQRFERGDSGVYTCTYNRLGRLFGNFYTWKHLGNIFKFDKLSGKGLPKDPIANCSLVIMDEAHCVESYRNIALRRAGVLKEEIYGNDDYLSEVATRHANGIVYFREELPRLKKIYPNIEFLCITATPDRLSTCKDMQGVLHFMVKEEEQEFLKKVTQKDVSGFNNLGMIQLPKGEANKILYFTGRVDTMYRSKEFFESKGLKCMVLWSENNEKRNNEAREEDSYFPGEFDNKYEEIAKFREKFLRKNINGVTNEEQGMFGRYDVILINLSLSAGIDINDKNCMTVILDYTDAEENIQARGRVRHSIDNLYVKDANILDHEARPIVIPDEFVGKDLSPQDKKDLVSSIIIRDEQGRRLKWTSIKKNIIAFDVYSVKEVRRLQKDGTKPTFTRIEKL